jgi:type VI protein secretion system component Hcp
VPLSLAARKLLNHVSRNQHSMEDQMNGEPKKDQQAPEVKTEPSSESLSESELDKVVGGETVQLTYGSIQWTYTKQKDDGNAAK